MQIKIVEVGVNVEIRFTINGIHSYTNEYFDTEKQARRFLESHGLKETDAE